MSRVEDQLSSNLDDVALWEVYGDELQERGDPRGEMIAWSVSLSRNPSGATAAEIRNWLLTHVSWAEPVSQDCLEAVLEPLRRRNVARVELAMGHVRHLDLVIEGSDESVCAWWAARLSKAAADPLVQFMHSAQLQILGSGAAAGAFSAPRWPVRALTVWADDCALPSPADLAKACPYLQALSIDGRVESAAPLAHTTVRRIAWTLGHAYEDEELDDEAVDADVGWLLGASLPALTELIVDRRLSTSRQEALTSRFGSIVRVLPGRYRGRFAAHRTGAD